MAPARDPDLTFEPRTRASARRLVALGLLGVLIWTLMVAAVVAAVASDRMVTVAFEFAAAVFVFALVWLSITVVLGRRRGRRC